jgi:hypothetical protein
VGFGGLCSEAVVRTPVGCRSTLHRMLLLAHTENYAVDKGNVERKHNFVWMGGGKHRQNELRQRTAGTTAALLASLQVPRSKTCHGPCGLSELPEGNQCRLASSAEIGFRDLPEPLLSQEASLS